MIQVQTELFVADNTGAKKIECIKVLGGSKRRYASIGDTIVVAVKEAIPKGKVKKGSVHKAVVVRVKKGIHRNDGSKVKFDNNAAVLTDEKGEPIGTRIFCPVTKELRSKGQTKIISLSPPCARGFISWQAEINSISSKNKCLYIFLSKEQNIIKIIAAY